MNTSFGTKFQIAILGESLDRANELYGLAAIEWLLCKRTGDHVFGFYKGDELVSSVNLENAIFDLPSLLGIIFAGTAEAFETVRSEWNSALPSAEITFKRIPEWEYHYIICASLECIADHLSLERRHSGRAALELATYRREFDRLQYRFSRLEEYIGRQSFQRLTEIFEYPPDSVRVTETSGRAQPDSTVQTDRRLIQELPVNSCGFSGLSIYVSAKPESEAKPLRVKLKALETAQIVGEWAIRADQARVGWIDLALSYAIEEPALSLVLIVEWPSETTAWGLALGAPHPYKEFCARTEEGEHLGSPLAMRLFGSVPGVRVSPTTTAIRPIDAPHTLGKFIPYEAYGAVVQVLPAAQESKLPLVSYDREIGCITVHPNTGGLTVARMSVVVPKHAWRLTAQICLAHERASATQFGLLICPPRDENRELLRLSQLDTRAPSFSGWKTLAPLETKTISLLLAASPPEEQLLIYLVTRQAPEASADFAWARFSKLEFNVLPAAMTEKNGTGKIPPFHAESGTSDEEQVVNRAAD